MELVKVFLNVFRPIGDYCTMLFAAPAAYFSIDAVESYLVNF